MVYRFIDKNDKEFKNQFGNSFVPRWDYAKVYAILNNLVYTGTLVNGRKTRVSIGSPKSVSKDPIIIEGTHEAIITKEEFEQANTKIVRINKKPKNDLEYPLKMLMKCGDCRRAMRRKARDVMNTYYVCGKRAKDATSSCRTRKVDEKRIEKLAYNAILQVVELLNAKLDNKPAKELKAPDFISELSSLDSQIESLKSCKIRLYENYPSEELTKEMFLKQKGDTDKKIADVEVNKSEIKQNLNSANTLVHTGDTQVNNLISIFSKSNKLTYEMAHNIIIDREDVSKIMRIINEMPSPGKDIFIDKVLTELDYSEIRKIYGKTESWARVTYYRAKIKITERIANYDK